MAWKSNTAEVVSLPISRQQRPIDMGHLAKQALGDWGIEVEVLRLFDEMSRTYFRRLETSTELPDLLMHLHSLRGASAGVGAWAIRDLAKAAEDELKSGAPVDPQRIEDIRVALEETSAFIADLLRDEPV